MSSLSSDLMYFASRMSGFSTNTFRLETNNQSTATSNSIVAFDLPANSIINLRSFKMFFNANAGKIASAGGRLPPVKDLIERVEVAMGGVVLSQGTNFTNVLCEAKKALHADYTDAVLGHPEYIRATSYVNPADTYTTTANENDSSTYYCVDEWEGFLGTADPMLFDTSIVPNIRIRLYMATDNVLSNVAGVTLGTASGSFADSAGANATSGPPLPDAPNATLPKYELTNIHATIECISLADMTYENMLASQMAKGGLEVPYKAYYTFIDSHSATSKFSVSASSLDRIWLAWRGSDYNSVTNPITIQGHKTQGGFIYKSSALVAGAVSGSATLNIDNLTGDAPVVGDVVLGDGVETGITISAVVSATQYTLSSTQTIADNTLLTFGSQDVGVPQYDVGGVLDTNNEKYKGRYFNFSQPVLWSAPTTEWKAQLQLNGAYMPQFSANIEQLYGITRNSLEMPDKAKQMTLDQYRKNFCVQCFRLNKPNSEFSRTLSGVDSRATNLAGIVRTENSVSGANLVIFAETTEILKIEPGRSLSVVV